MCVGGGGGGGGGERRSLSKIIAAAMAALCWCGGDRLLLAGVLACKGRGAWGQ